jgi:hypothetical protein
VQPFAIAFGDAGIGTRKSDARVSSRRRISVMIRFLSSLIVAVHTLSRTAASARIACAIPHIYSRFHLGSPARRFEPLHRAFTLGSFQMTKVLVN